MLSRRLDTQTSSTERHVAQLVKTFYRRAFLQSCLRLFQELASPVFPQRASFGLPSSWRSRASKTNSMRSMIPLSTSFSWTARSRLPPAELTLKAQTGPTTLVVSLSCLRTGTATSGSASSACSRSTREAPEPPKQSFPRRCKRRDSTPNSVTQRLATYTWTSTARTSE